MKGLKIQRNNPSFEMVNYNSKINLTNFHFNEETNETSHSVVKIDSDYLTHEGEIDSSDIFLKPSLYKFAANDNYDDRNLYISGAVNFGGPSSIYSEATGAMVMNQKLSEYNQEYKFFYNSVDSYAKSLRYSINPFENLYSSRSLHPSDLDSEYHNITAWNRSFYEGVKNTSNTTLDGDLPVIVTQTAPTVAVPSNTGIGQLTVDSNTN